MATLTLKRLKTSEPASPKPTNDLIGKFAVMRHARHQSSFRFTAIHESAESATKEAARLLKKYPTERFLVLQVVTGVE